MAYSYQIDPRSKDLGGGWRLKLLEDGEEIGGGVFPADADADPEAGIVWWNGMTETERGHWLSVAQSARPVDAWAAYLSEEARSDAQDQGEEWLATRGEAAG